MPEGAAAAAGGLEKRRTSIPLGWLSGLDSYFVTFSVDGKRRVWARHLGRPRAPQPLRRCPPPPAWPLPLPAFPPARPILMHSATASLTTGVRVCLPDCKARGQDMGHMCEARPPFLSPMELSMESKERLKRKAHLALAVPGRERGGKKPRAEFQRAAQGWFKHPAPIQAECFVRATRGKTVLLAFGPLSLPQPPNAAPLTGGELLTF